MPAHAHTGLHDADQLLQSVHSRVQRAATLSRWIDRWAGIEKALRDELAAAQAELSLARTELAFWRRTAADEGTPPPPPEYLQALRTPQSEPYRQVTVSIDGLPWTIGLRRDRPHLDPAQTLASWRDTIRSARAVRAELGAGGHA